MLGKKVCHHNAVMEKEQEPCHFHFKNYAAFNLLMKTDGDEIYHYDNTPTMQYEYIISSGISMHVAVVTDSRNHWIGKITRLTYRLRRPSRFST